jgi:hypothetical protein
MRPLVQDRDRPHLGLDRIHSCPGGGLVGDVEGPCVHPVLAEMRRQLELGTAQSVGVETVEDDVGAGGEKALGQGSGRFLGGSR